MKRTFESSCWLVGVIVLALAGCEEPAPPISSCNKVQAHGMCTEYRGYPVDEARLGCSEGFTEGPCPTGNLVGSCEKHLGSAGGNERVQVDFYYEPVQPPHTAESLRNLCSSPSWTWTSGR